MFSLCMTNTTISVFGGNYRIGVETANALGSADEFIEVASNITASNRVQFCNFEL